MSHRSDVIDVNDAIEVTHLVRRSTQNRDRYRFTTKAKITTEQYTELDYSGVYAVRDVKRKPRQEDINLLTAIKAIDGVTTVVMRPNSIELAFDKVYSDDWGRVCNQVTSLIARHATFRK